MKRARAGGLIGIICAAFAAGAASGASDPGRLGRDVVPLSASVALTLDPSQPDYTGRVTYPLSVRRRASDFRFHARDLTLSTVVLTGPKGSVPVRWAREGEVVTVTPRSALAPGRYTLDVRFTNHFNTRASSLYRLTLAGDSYAFTQFEATDAREAFPCWDEPSFKIPWRITLTVPATALAVANTPPASVRRAGATKTVVFRRTPPLPSYLIALAVGPLETVDVPGTSVPCRVLTPRGQAALAAEARRITASLLAELEKYFGRPYPFAKLDLLAVPEFTPGAMENAGAITFADRILLLDPTTASAQQKLRLASVLAHELAHMWFGDLVTMEWWDDLWLNESFASWMGDKVVDRVFPESHVGLHELGATEAAFLTDAQPSARAIRKPVASADNLYQLADELAYDKGQAVLGMFERWVGEEAFRRGVLAYLDAHLWGNATGADLWSAISRAAGRDVSGPMASFLDQPGVPLVSATLTGTTLELRQRRFHAAGVDLDTSGVWGIPVRLELGRAGGTDEKSVLLTDRSARIELSSAPLWVNLQGDAAGYYRWTLPREEMARLVERPTVTMDVRERAAFLGNLGALLDAGLVTGDAYLRTVERFADDPAPEVVERVVGSLDRVRYGFVDEDLEAAFAAYVRRVLTPALSRMGRSPAAGEPQPVTLLRPTLLLWLGAEGHDPAVLAWADSVARVLQASPGAVDASLGDVAVWLTAASGDSTLFETYRGRFEAAREPTERVRYLGALGRFQSPRLVERALAYALAGPLRPQELTNIPRQLSRDPRRGDRLWRWVTENYGAIGERLPPVYMVYLAWFAAGCSEERLVAARAFFADPAHSPPGVDVELAKIADIVNLCSTLRAREGAAVARYLKSSTAAN